MSSPNILLILTDQQHLNTISAAGNPNINTPSLDRLKQRGTLFTQSYCSNPVCGPSGSCLFSGRTSSETGVFSNGASIRSGIPNLGEWLSQQSAYEVLYAGKWHVPKSYTHFIPGFNVIQTGINGQGNLGDTAVSRACEAFLHNRTSINPFFLVTSFLSPHDVCEWIRNNAYNPARLRYPELADQLPPLPDNFDYDTREPEYTLENRKRREPARGNWDETQWRYYIWNYYRHVEMVDAEIGRVLQAVHATDRLKDTIVIFTSDHGEGLGHHQNVLKNNLYEEALAVPLIVAHPESLPKDVIDTTHLTTGLDVYPTVCDFAGITPPEHLRGRSLKPLLEGTDENWHDYVVSEANRNRGRVVRTLQHKYVVYADDPVDQLFDMHKDPGETLNLASDSQYESVIREHRDRLIVWEKQLDVAPNAPYADVWWRS